jgi:DNA-binding IscR family transcriptional regulator
MIYRTGRHVTLAPTFMAQLMPGEFAGASQIAGEVGAPGNYLGKLLKQLAAEGLVESQKKAETSKASTFPLRIIEMR